MKHFQTHRVVFFSPNVSPRGKFSPFAFLSVFSLTWILICFQSEHLRSRLSVSSINLSPQLCKIFSETEKGCKVVLIYIQRRKSVVFMVCVLITGVLFRRRMWTRTLWPQTLWVLTPPTAPTHRWACFKLYLTCFYYYKVRHFPWCLSTALTCLSVCVCVKVQALLQEVQQLREELRSRDQTIAQLTLQLVSVHVSL